jgi:hypothetical protein
VIVLNQVYPVGHTHLKYYDDVMEYFGEEGFEPEGSTVLTVGADLVGWYLKDQYPEAHVETVEIDPRTAEMQEDIGERLSRGEDPVEIRQDLEQNPGTFLDSRLDLGEEIGTIYPGVVEEIGENASRPDASHVTDFSGYSGDADIVLTNNVSDYMETDEFFQAVESTGADYLEMYSVLPGADELIEEGSEDLGMKSEIDPDLRFDWEGLPGVTSALFSR